MREILFRAKRTDNGEWIVGCLLVDYITGQYFLHALGNSVNESSKIGEEGYLRFVAFEIDPSTLCQYTGMKDKNGNRIWENDIVVCKQYIDGNFIDYHIEFGFVEMKHGAYGLHRDRPDAYYRPFKDWLEDYEYEVLGNIFDTPELLKGE